MALHISEPKHREQWNEWTTSFLRVTTQIPASEKIQQCFFTGCKISWIDSAEIMIINCCNPVRLQSLQLAFKLSSRLQFAQS